MNDGTIDITELANNMKDTFITWATLYLFNGFASMTLTSWIQLPIISGLAKASFKFGVSLLANSSEMKSFFINTAIKKPAQAKDYTNAIKNKNLLPPNAPQDVYEKYVLEELRTFRNFVRVTN